LDTCMPRASENMVAMSLMVNERLALLAQAF
jgi:hypothetical protein